ncbi:gluconate 2-dehydrogenase subunit 3 family protein [Sorangium sp. So ce1128]
MPARIVTKDDEYVLNHCARFCARENKDERHNFGQYESGDPRGRYCEAFRFPIIDGYGDTGSVDVDYALNEVTFLYIHEPMDAAAQVAVVGTFSELHAPIPLRRVEGTRYSTVTVLVPKGQAHTYLFLVDGEPTVDPINPQRTTLDNGRTWSRFFTHFTTTLLVLDRRERELLEWLTDAILPFPKSFLRSYYNRLEQWAKERHVTSPHVIRLDASVGVVNFIDKILAREESHHVVDYRICLDLIGQVLRGRYPGADVRQLPKEAADRIFMELATNSVEGWNYERYGNPSHFLTLLRRHTVTGAFSHPKYGGNAGAAGWAYLEDRYVDPTTGRSLFDWRRAVERPLGNSPTYRGLLGRSEDWRDVFPEGDK